MCLGLFLLLDSLSVEVPQRRQSIDGCGLPLISDPPPRFLLRFCISYSSSYVQFMWGSRSSRAWLQIVMATTTYRRREGPQEPGYHSTGQVGDSKSRRSEMNISLTQNISFSTMHFTNTLYRAPKLNCPTRLYRSVMFKMCMSSEIMYDSHRSLTDATNNG